MINRMTTSVNGHKADRPKLPRENKGVAGLFASRGALLVASLAYAWSLAYAHSEYLSYAWGYYGFSFRPLGAGEISLLIVLVAIGSLGIPRTLDRPSAIILLLLYLIVFVPSVVISLGLNTDRIERYGLSLSAMAVMFWVSGRFVQQKPALTVRQGGVPGNMLTFTLVGVYAVSTLILLIAYRSIMTFASLEDIYQQRLAASDDNVILGYLRTYYASVISPGVLALGLIQSRRILAVLGVAGCVMTYMIDAQKTALLLPAVMIILYFALRNRLGAIQASAAAIAGLAAFISLTVALNDSSGIARFLNTFLVFRTIAIPGLTFSQYSDLFSSLGYTWWSNVTGLSLFIPAPAAFVSHPYWPSLGRIVGDYYYGFGVVNANANLFSGEGVAAAGWFGVIVIGLALTAWLRLIDTVASGWNRLLTLLVMVPVGIALTNGHLSTVLISFGGAFWTLLFLYFKPQHAFIGKTSGYQHGSRRQLI